ncbi:MAG: hypothetical protein LBS09_02775 [Bacteroidales bacterium]|jgi:hypothetical protein|nr:hypothetical protein [Bacteroidales bacterium]
MKEELNRFFIRSLSLLALIVGISVGLFSVAWKNADFPGNIVSVAFIWATTCGFHFWLMRVVARHPKSFGGIFLMQTGIKLFLFAAYIAVYLYLFREYAVRFVILFLVTYIIFAVFEVVSILKFVKNSGKDKISN